MCFGGKVTEDDKKSKQIDRVIEDNKRQQASNVKLLLLGTRDVFITVGDFSGYFFKILCHRMNMIDSLMLLEIKIDPYNRSG